MRYKDSSLCIEQIADEGNLTVNYLGRKFKSVTGMSIADKIMEFRMNEAERLLLETDEEIKEIVFKTGFTNNSYFTSVFKKNFGVTPSQYRKK